MLPSTPKLQPVKLLMGLLTQNPTLDPNFISQLKTEFGEIDAISESSPFMHTRYYVKEMGESLHRYFISFSSLISRIELPDLKNKSRQLENSLSDAGRRRVNIDPGYLTLGQFFLASTKDQRQRVYVRDGIYVEPTLYYRDGSFHAFEWTYPDYATGHYFEFLSTIRAIYLQQLKNFVPRLPGTDS